MTTVLLDSHVVQWWSAEPERLSDVDLARIVDRSWNPPVSLGVRLVSVITDDLQHAGQAAFVRGVLERT